MATHAWTHLIELRELAARFGVQGGFLGAARHPADFDLETAADEIGARFADVRVQLRTSAHVEGEIARSGSLHIGIAAGLVEGVRR